MKLCDTLFYLLVRLQRWTDAGMRTDDARAFGAIGGISALQCVNLFSFIPFPEDELTAFVPLGIFFVFNLFLFNVNDRDVRIVSNFDEKGPGVVYSLISVIYIVATPILFYIKKHSK